MSKLVGDGCVKVVTSLPYTCICSPLSVVMNSGEKKRLVCDLRYLNRFLWKQKFKYEDLRIALPLFRPGDYVFTFNLKSGYHHIDIYELHQNFLGFE